MHDADHPEQRDEHHDHGEGAPDAVGIASPPWLHGRAEAGMRTVLVLTGSTSRSKVATFPYGPTMIAESIADVVSMVADLSPNEDEELSAD